MAKAKKKSVSAKKSTKVVNKSHSKKNVKVVQKVDLRSAGKDLLKSFTKPLTRGQQIGYLANVSGLPKKDIVMFVNSLESMIAHHLRNFEQIPIAGLMKVMVIKKPATKAREGINPFTGQPTIFKAKPAKRVVRIRPLKKIKDMVV